jgi:hypothetical protein
MRTALASTDIAISQGRLFYAASVESSTGQRVTLQSCPTNSPCVASSVQVHRQAAIDRIVGADQTGVYFMQSGKLYLCPLTTKQTTCDGKEVLIAQADSVATGYQLVETSSTYYLPLATGLFGTCPKKSCMSFVPVTPDPTLDADGKLGFVTDTAYSSSTQEDPSARAFVVDDQAVYWATSSIFGDPGALIVSTPMQ